MNICAWLVSKAYICCSLAIFCHHCLTLMGSLLKGFSFQKLGLYESAHKPSFHFVPSSVGGSHFIGVL